jgi:hypothetical protein
VCFFIGLVEDFDGLHQDVKLAKECLDANLTGFPAWIINGKRLDGEQTFDKLETELALSESAAAPQQP